MINVHPGLRMLLLFGLPTAALVVLVGAAHPNVGFWAFIVVGGLQFFIDTYFFTSAP